MYIFTQFALTDVKTFIPKWLIHHLKKMDNVKKKKKYNLSLMCFNSYVFLSTRSFCGFHY